MPQKPGQRRIREVEPDESFVDAQIGVHGEAGAEDWTQFHSCYLHLADDIERPLLMVTPSYFTECNTLYDVLAVELEYLRQLALPGDDCLRHCYVDRHWPLGESTGECVEGGLHLLGCVGWLRLAALR